MEFINWDHNNSLIGHFDIDNIRELIDQKFYCPTLQKDVKTYVKDCKVSLALKTVKHKPYSNLQLLQVLIHR